MIVEERNKRTVLNFFNLVDSGKLIQAKKLLSPDFKLHSPQLEKPWGVKEISDDVEKFYKGFPDGYHEVYDLLAEGDKVVVRLAYLGTHTGEYEGIPASLSRVKIAGTHVMSLEDGRFKEWWAMEDILGFMQQLGFTLEKK